jgi:diaminopimelate epimerase
VRIELYSGAGNRFLLAEQDSPGPAWTNIARDFCARPLFRGDRGDGLLVVRPDPDGRARMTIFNADGSRPEACGNGLRCAGWHLARTRGGDRLLVLTDVGERTVEVRARSGRVAVLDTEMGGVTVDPLSAPWPSLPRLIDVHRVDVGNPHCVLRVEDERSVELESIGRELQGHADYPRGVNVGALAKRERAWHLRVWERGVGETDACGTGACAAAALVGARSGETEIRMRGGVLTVRQDAQGRFYLRGQAEHLGALDLDPLAPHGSRAGAR